MSGLSPKGCLGGAVVPRVWSGPELQPPPRGVGVGLTENLTIIYVSRSTFINTNEN